MPTLPPDEAVLEHLAGAGLGLVAAPASGANGFTGQVQPPLEGLVPYRTVFCLLLGRGKNDAIQGDGTSKKVFHVQVRVRVEAGENAAGQVLARACLDALHGAEPSGYAYCLANSPAPADLGNDPHGLPEWSFTVRLGTIA